MKHVRLTNLSAAALLAGSVITLLSACSPIEPTGTQVVQLPGSAIIASRPIATVGPANQSIAVQSAPSFGAPINVAAAPSPTTITVPSTASAFASPIQVEPAASSAPLTNARLSSADAVQEINRISSDVIGAADRQLSGEEIRSLISGKTLLSQKVDDEADKQVGSFLPSGQMVVSTGGQNIGGTWSIEGNSVCYLLSGSKFCSTMHRTAKSYNGQPVYYFRRANGNVGEPTVIVYSIQ